MPTDDSSINLLLGLLSGGLMVLVGMVPAIWWAIKSRTPFYWLLAGAAVWFVAVAIKGIAYLIIGQPLVDLWKAALPGGVALILGALYAGSFTGTFEAGLTLLAGLTWRSWAKEPKRAVAIGLGAGGFEAICLGGFVLFVVFLAIVAPQVEAEIEKAFREIQPIASSSSDYLAGPFERSYTILVHVAFRMLALLAVAKRKWSFFVYSFLLATAIDAVASYYMMSKVITTMSAWLVELTLFPFGLISLAIAFWCYRNWPKEVQQPQQVAVLDVTQP